MATRKKRKSSRKRQPLPSWVWLVTGLVIGLSATYILRTDSNLQTPAKEQNKTGSVYDSDKPRKFDFYTLLPELEVVVPTEESPSGESGTETDSSALYILQVGSFKNYQDADEMKASLALMGIETDIQKVTVNGKTWHRVRVGPNSDRRALQAIKNRLAKQRIDTLLLQVRS